MIFTKPEMVLIAEAEAIKQEIDPSIVCAVIDVMSQWHPEKILPNTDTIDYSLAYSSAEEREIHISCIGLLQFTGKQARGFQYKQPIIEFLHPQLNCEVGIKILKESISAANSRLDKGLTVMYGYRVVSSLPRVFAKIPVYQSFLTSPLRPTA